MAGIEILSIGEIGVGSAFNWGMAILGGCFAGLFAGVMEAMIEDDIAFGFIIFIITFLIAGALIGLGNARPTHYIPIYKVTISDEVSMNDFMEKYEILEQDGKIYTVKERTLDAD